MPRQFTDDPIADFEGWDADQERQLARRPTCTECDEHIQEETAYYINGEWICHSCMECYLREVLPK